MPTRVAAEVSHRRASFNIALRGGREDSFYENAALRIRFTGRDMVEFQYGASYAFLPDLEATVDFEHVVGDAVVQVGRLTGTPTGDLLGVPASGEQIDVPYAAVIAFENGKMKSEHVYYDLADFCDQAGLDLELVRKAAAALQSPGA